MRKYPRHCFILRYLEAEASHRRQHMVLPILEQKKPLIFSNRIIVPKMQLSSDQLCICLLVTRLASSIPLAPQSGPPIPPLPFPADEDISSCHLTSTIKSPTQPWHSASLDPIDDNGNLATGLANQSHPLPLSSHTAPVAVTRKRNDYQTRDVVCTTIAAFTFTDLRLSPTLNSHITRPRLTLSPGTYVLSFTNNYRVRLLGVSSLVEGQQRSTMDIHDVSNKVSGTVAFVLTRNTDVKFFFQWGMAHWPAPGVRLASGEVAVFRIGPG